jgi:NAD(P)-dependent dehydrogenase (short-subunit alcohol dehydrogenase family)
MAAVAWSLGGPHDHANNRKQIRVIKSRWLEPQNVNTHRCRISLRPLGGEIRLTNALLPALLASQAGAIVNISSGAATMPIGSIAHYGAAKAALNSYSRSLALDVAPNKPRVNVVSAGPVTTPGSREFSDALGVPPDLFAKDLPLRRYGAPEDIAEVVALLVSDRGKWMTGANVSVDGGLSVR